MKNKLQLQPIVLPTNEASEIALYKDELYEVKKYPKGLEINQHLYLCSQESIKEGDWCYFGSLKEIRKCANPNPALEKANGVLKIEFTTDPKLIADGVPAIPEKAFIKVHKRYLGTTGYETLEVNFLEEFTKRYNQMDALTTHYSQKSGIKVNQVLNPFTEKDNQKGESTIGYGKWKDSGKVKQKGVDVEKLSLQDIIDKRNTTSRYNSEKKRYDYSEQDIKDVVEENQALQDNDKKFSLEDMRKAYYCGSAVKQISFKEYLQSLTKEPKGDIIIECEMECKSCGSDMTYHKMSCKGERVSQIKLNSNREPIIHFKL